MSPHDHEIKLFNDIIATIDKIEGTLSRLHCDYKQLPKEVEGGLFLCSIWALDLKDNFTKYANRRYE